MGSGKGDAPDPPDPQETASAQTSTNLATAIANNTMGLVDQTTPTGTLEYTQTGTQTFEDPYTGQSYDIPTYSAETKLSPKEQYKLSQKQAAESNLLDVAVERSDFLKDYLPETEAITDQIDSKLYDLGAQRLDPRFADQEASLRTRLANQGIVEGSEAYNREMELLGQSKNDAYNQLILGGRGQALAEVNQPINQITALLSGSQVSSPGVQLQSPSQLPTTDVAGLINSNYNQQLQAYSNQQANSNSLMGGLLGAGATVLGAPGGSLIGGLFL